MDENPLHDFINKTNENDLDDDLLSPKAGVKKGISDTEMDFEETIVPILSSTA
mgnify:CR=1 FL=1